MESILKQVSVRLIEDAPLLSKEPVSNPQIAVDTIAEHIRTYDREVCYILSLKKNGEPINCHMVSMGSVDYSIVSMREVFKAALLSNAANIILLHNHPSGSVNPSVMDQKITEKLRRAGALMDVELLDHIIVGDKERGYFSFKEHDMLDDFKEWSILEEAKTKTGKKTKKKEERER